MPTVSILTPTYKTEPQKLIRCLDSVARQTISDFEHLVCSDGALEETARLIVQRYGTRFKYSFSETPDRNYGNGIRRRLLAQAKGRFVLFLDADNFIFPAYLEKAIKTIETNPTAAFTLCEILHYGPLLPIHGTPPVVLKGEFKTGHIDTLQVFSKAEAIKDIGWQGNKYAADAETYIALAAKYPFVRINECLGVHA